MDFSKLPLNTNRIYAVARDGSGTEIFVPATTHEDAVAKKIELKRFLATQPIPEPEPEPPKGVA